MNSVRGVRVAVVGAGVLGLATARALAQRGADVTVYERFELGHTRGSSHGTSRIFRLSHAEEHWIRLAQRAYELWRELERETGASVLKLNGLLDVEADSTARLDALRRSGVEHEVLDPDEALRRFGVAFDGDVVFSPEAGISLAEEARGAFAASARNAGAQIEENARIERLGDVDGDAVVVTAGGWAPKLLADAGVRLDATPTRETVAYFPLREERMIPSVIDERDPGAGDLSFYALEAPGVGLKAGLHKSGGAADPDVGGEPDEQVVRRVADWVARRFPFVAPEPLRAETCIYTNTPDDAFVCERRGRYVVGSACSGHGFKFAPAVGEILANLVY